MSIFFIVSIISTLIHYILLNDTFFDSYSAVISLIGSNFYVMLPFMYLIVMIVMNRDQLKIERKRK